MRPSILLSFVLGLLLLLPGMAAANGLEDEQREAMRSVISTQLEAFQAGDAERAFGMAATEIQKRFRTAERFVRMVREHYPMIHSHMHHEFQATQLQQGYVVQPVLIIAHDQSVHIALYEMVRQPDGQWRIGSVGLVGSAVQSV